MAQEALSWAMRGGGGGKERIVIALDPLWVWGFFHGPGSFRTSAGL